MTDIVHGLISLLVMNGAVGQVVLLHIESNPLATIVTFSTYSGVA